MGDLEGEEIKDATEIHQVNLGLPGRTHIAINYLEYRDYLQLIAFSCAKTKTKTQTKTKAFVRSFVF